MAIPKKPLAVSSAKKKLPVELDWGPGIPKDRLRYINADEEALIKRFRTSKSARDYAGIPAYADDSASSKGVERSGTTTGKTTGSTSSSSSSSRSSSGGLGQGGQSRGPSGAGQGPNSPSSSASSASTGSKSAASSPSAGSNSFSAASPAGSKAPNAAAQAASNAFRSSQTNASATVGGSKAPNMAAAYASQKLNATSSALKAGQQPQSIQGLINSQAAQPNSPNAAGAYASGLLNARNAPRSASGAEGVVQRDWFNGQLGGLYNDPAINKALPSALREGMWNQRISDATRVAQGLQPVGYFGERTLAPWDDAGFRTREQAAANAKRGTGIKASFHNYGLAADIVTPGMPAYLAKGYKSWEDKFARANQDLAGQIPDNYGIKWGGDFKKSDPAHFQVGAGSRSDAIKTYGSTVVAEGIRPDGVVGPTAAYGRDIPTSSVGSVGLAAAVTPEKSSLQKALDAWDVPGMSAIPEPNGILRQYNYPQAPHVGPAFPDSGIASSPLAPPRGVPAATQVAGMQQPAPQTVIGDPRVGMPVGSYPASSPTQAPTNPFGALNPVAAGRLTRLGTQLAVDDAMSASTPPVPNMRPPSQNMLAAQTPPSALPGFSPQAAPGDSVPEDGPSPVYSDNPMQGPSNPVQESPAVEDPGVTKQRQTKYASRGATIGSVIAGPLGAVIGGTLGWQMGKTPPGQRRAIASNPQALQANVQSINTMVEERGGKGNPQMRVTDAGLKDVLENPAKVAQNPQSYTTLEQMLASLALGVDPETGQPI